MKGKGYVVYVPILFLCWWFTMMNGVNKNSRNYVIWSDSEGYYMYLPGLFILKDLHKIPSGSVVPQLNKKGEHVIKYTCGIAMLELPFFLGAKWYCEAKDLDWKDYFNIHYMRAMALSGYFYGFLGLFFLSAALRREFSEIVTFWTVLSVFHGTNLFHYMTRSMSMSHAYSFFLFAFLLWITPGYFSKPTFWKSAAVGVTFGLIVLIRPTNTAIVLLLAGYGVYSMQNLHQRLSFFRLHWKSLVIVGFSAGMMCIPQLLYWYEMTGSIVRYSYTNEGFIYWLKPKIAAVLFDVQNGLFLYSPITLLMIGGILHGIQSQKYQGPILAIIFIVITYVFASWWAWWFGGAFGHRSYVEYYALFAIPLAGMYDRIIRQRSELCKILAFAATTFLMYYGVKMSLLHSYLPGPWDGADWRWNWDKIEWVWSYLLKKMC